MNQLYCIFFYFVFSSLVIFSAIGTELDKFVPNPTGNGRGITTKGKSSLAYYSTTGSEDIVYMLDLKTHSPLGSLNTNLDVIDPGRSYGTLAWDSVNTRLWSARYVFNEGEVGWIDPNTGVLTEVFDAANTDPLTIGVDGLAVDSDGSLWLSADGLGQTSTKIYHYNSLGLLIDFIEVPFGNSGIAIDGDDLWLANIDNQTMHKFSKSGVDSGVSFATSADIDPEGLTIDYCTFSGKKALWTYSSDISGASMAAYEIGDSNNEGCVSSIPSEIEISTDDVEADSEVTFDLTSASDPSGTNFTYTWDFGDGSQPVSGPYGIINYVFTCAGTYLVQAAVVDLNGLTRVYTRSVKVGFPSSAIKIYKGLLISPVVSLTATSDPVKTKKATVSLYVSKIDTTGKRAKILKVDYWIDTRLFTDKQPTPGASKKIRPNLAHNLKIKIYFKNGKIKKIRTCFFA